MDPPPYPGYVVTQQSAGQPMVTQQFGQPMVTQQFGQPVMVTQQSRQPMVTQQSGQPMVTQQFGQPMVTQQSGQPMVTLQSRQPMVTQQSGQPMVTQQFGQPMVTQQSGQPMVTQQFGQPVIMSTYPTQQIITQPSMPAVQTVRYVQASQMQGQVFQRHINTAPGYTQPVVVTSQPMAASHNMNYAKTVPGVFKIIEFFSLLIAWACAARYKEIYSFYEPNGRLKFFLAVSILAWLLALLVFFLFVASCHKQCGGVIAAVFGAVTYSFFTVLLLVASGLLADDAVSWRPLYRWLGSQNRAYVNNLYAAVAFGFLSTVLFFIDAILFCTDDANRVSPPPAATVVQPQTVFHQQATVVHVGHN